MKKIIILILIAGLAWYFVPPLIAGDPLKITREYVEGVISLNNVQIKNNVCEEEKKGALARADAVWVKKTQIYVNAKWDFSGLNYILVSEDKDNAVVQVVGKVSGVSGIGTPLDQNLNWTFQLIKESWRWKVCGQAT